MYKRQDQDNSVLAAIATKVAWIFAPLGFGNWRATVASVSGDVYKRQNKNLYLVAKHCCAEEERARAAARPQSGNNNK